MVVAFADSFECSGVRYVLLIEFNDENNECLENKLFSKLARGFAEE